MYSMPRGKSRPERVVKTTVELPVDLWQAAKMEAMKEQSDLRAIIIRGLNVYLNKGDSHAR
jgi:hypothetical protein